MQKCWQLKISNIEVACEDMAVQLAHATFGFHPTGEGVEDNRLIKIFRHILFTEINWYGWEPGKSIWYLFKIKPDDETLVKLGTLFRDIFPGCDINLLEGNWNPEG